MKLPEPLYPGVLLHRYKRFLADVALPGGEVVTAHCPNSGSMLGCALPGSPVMLSRSADPKRRLPYTWELVKVDTRWVGINTLRANRLAREAIEAGRIPELAGYRSIRGEVPYGTRSRIDLLLSGPQGECYLEVKNVTLAQGDTACFPDAVTLRGQKHLRELMAVVAAGRRGVVLFVVQRGDVTALAPADRIDPQYARLLRLALRRGVEVLAYRADPSPGAILLDTPLPVLPSPPAPGGAQR
jgi:sugar fermentation stimulation protein A